MSIRTDFEKALTDKFWPDGGNSTLDHRDISDIVDEVSLFSAKWMAERMITEAIAEYNSGKVNQIYILRNLAKDLDA